MFPDLPVLVELVGGREGERSFPPRLEISYPLHMHLTWNHSTQLDSLRVPPGFLTRGGDWVVVVSFFVCLFCSWPGSTEGDSPSPQNVSHSHMQPKGLLD